MRKALRFLAAVTSLIILLSGTSNVFSASSTGKFNMSYIYFGNSNLYTSTIDKTQNSIDDISPSYFDLNPDGSLKLTLAVDQSFVDQMHQRGIKVTPFLSNHWDRNAGINALANRTQLAAQLAAAVQTYNLDGVNVDIENVTENQRSDYTDFIRLLRQQLPQDKGLSIAVAPNPYNVTTGWNASYDFSALANYCDYLMLMTYDEHYEGGYEGPVASHQFVEASIASALKLVPKEKLVLGIAFYGRLWKQGASYGGYGISNSYVESLISKYNGTVVFDNVAKSPKATITIKTGDEKPVVEGQTLDAGTYDIWFENDASIKDKLQLVQKYDLKGTGSWSLGQEDPNTWDYYSLWLNGTYFNDIANNWAAESILDVANKGWMIGVNGNQFQPGATLTRAQAAVTLVRALGLSDTAPDPIRGAAFADTVNHWAGREIQIARQYDIIKGVGGNYFSPDSPVTREQMAVMLERVLHGLKSPDAGQSEVAFSDVNASADSWSMDAIDKMAFNNIIQGYPDGLFHPTDSINRAQMATLMDRSTTFIPADFAAAAASASAAADSTTTASAAGASGQAS